MSVTTETLRIVNEVVYKGKGESTKLKSDMKATEEGVKKTGISLDKLATASGVAAAAFGVVAVGAKQFYDTLKAGADIQAAQFTFDNLTASIGTTSDAMLGDLQTATKGMISDLELMQFANQTVAMGLGSTNEEVAALAELGSTLGAAFRGDAVAGMEEFNLLLANQSIPRLDSFGISAGAVRTRIAELQEQFPDMTREAAFTQAVLEEGQQTMDKLGDSSVTAASDFAQFEAALKNARDEVLLELIEAFADDMPSAVDKATDAIEDFTEAFDSEDIRKTIDFLETLWKFTAPGMAQALRDAIPEAEGLSNEFANMPPHVAAAKRGMDEAAAAANKLERANRDLVAGSRAGRYSGLEGTNEVVEDFVRLIPRFGDSMNRMGDDYDGLEPPIRRTNEAIEENIEVIDRAALRQEILAKNAGLAAEAHRQFNATLGDYFVEISTAEEFTFNAGQELYNLVAAGDASAETMGGLAVALGIMSAEEAEAFLKTTILRGEIIKLAEDVLAGKLSAEDAALAAQGLADGLFNTAAEATRAAEAARLLKADLDNIPRNITVTVDVQTGSTVVQQNGQGPGITSATGNVFPHGGMSLVGEFGPEFVRLPAGAQVISTNRTANISNSTTNNLQASSRRGAQLVYDLARRMSRPASVTG